MYFLRILCIHSSHHPALPSFPTRRSSDLPNVNEICSPALRPRRRRLGGVNEVVVIPHRQAGGGFFVDDQDRKSTRLNSSHGYISYAVFCLKKKNLTTSCHTNLLTIL